MTEIISDEGIGMRFTATSTELQKILGQIGGVIPAKSTLPILENFLFQITDSQLRITATDLDISMSVTIRVKGLQDGIIAVPAKRLFETIRALPNTEITFTAESESHRIMMATENGEYKLSGESSENYPAVPSVASGDELEI